MWRYEAVVQREQRVHARRPGGQLGGLLLDVVQCRAGDATVAQRLVECRIVDVFAAGAVDEDRRRLHLRQPRGVDDVVRLRRVGRHDIDDVGRREQLVQFDLAHTVGAHQAARHIGVVGDNLEAEDLQLAGNVLGDAPEADQAPGRATETLGRHAGRTPVPLAGMGGPVIHGDAAQQHEAHRDGMVGHLLDAVVGHVGDEDAVLVGRLDVQDVDADAVPADDLAPRQLFDGRPHDLGILLQDGVRVRRQLAEPFAGLALQSDHLGADRLEHAALDVEIRIVVIADVDLELRHHPASW